MSDQTRAENLLLTFPDIRNAPGRGNDIFDRATEAALSRPATSGRVLSFGVLVNDPRKAHFGPVTRWRIRRLMRRDNLLAAQRLVLRRLA